MLDFNCTVDDRELIKNLETLGPRSKPVLRKELRPLANEVKKAIKPLVPKDKGPLRKSIAVKPIKSRRFYTAGFRIFPRYVKTEHGEKFYAFAPEFGVEKGRGKQDAVEYLKKGSAIAEAFVPRCKEAIARGIVKAFEQG